MTNEIKEILFLLHNDRLTESGKRKLEDYITNLQQENERLKKQYVKEEKKLFHDNEILQQRIDTALEKLDDKRMIFKEELVNILRGDE